MTRIATIRAHGTRNRYMMGATGSDPANGCHCQPCTAANTLYQNKRRGGALIDAAETRQHIEWLRRNRIGKRLIADLAGVETSTVYRAAKGATLIHRRSADRILAVNLDTARRRARFVPADTTRRLIGALIDAGWTRRAIAAALGYRSPALQLNHATITPLNAEKVEQLARVHVPGAWAAIVAGADTDAEERRHAANERKRKSRAAARSEAA